MSDEREPVGSVGEEALKLLQALQGWAKESGADSADAASSVFSGVAASWHEVNEHIATGGEDCRYCPVCQVIGAVRSTSPEVRQHLASAVTSLAQAVTGLIAPHVPTDPGGRARQDPVEKIDLDDDAAWEDD